MPQPSPAELRARLIFVLRVSRSLKVRSNSRSPISERILVYASNDMALKGSQTS